MASADWEIVGFSGERVVACGGDRRHRSAMDPRTGENCRDPAGNCIGDRIHVVLPPERHSPGAESGRVDRCGEDVGGAGAADGDYGITFANLSEEKFECSNLVSSAERCVEVVPLDPEIGSEPGQRLDRGGQAAKLHPGEASERWKPGEKGESGPTCGGLPRLTRLAEWVFQIPKLYYT